ncbi:MAG: hypothetical protein DHS20C08_02860 [Rhodomicrobium sp.]|nr:MAG: hypothetical protein DHS20C08_02860 [Rhodomicrobium sp.]
MPLELRTGPVEEPVSLTELKNALRIDDTADDLLLSSLITAARVMIETTTARLMINQSWGYFRKAVRGAGVVHLPLSPLQSVDEILIHHQDGSSTSLDSSAYTVDPAKMRPKLQFNNSSEPESGQHSLASNLNSLEIRFTAGYGGAASAVPDDLKQAVQMLAAHWYEQRSPIGPGGSLTDMPAGVTALIAPHKDLRLQ